MIRDSLLRSQRRSLRSLCLVCNCGKACIPPDTKGSCHFRFNLVIMCAGVKSQEKKTCRLSSCKKWTMRPAMWVISGLYWLDFRLTWGPVPWKRLLAIEEENIENLALRVESVESLKKGRAIELYLDLSLVLTRALGFLVWGPISRGFHCLVTPG